METKKCSMCNLILPLINFATRKNRKNLLYQSNCKSCQKEYRKEHYEKNKVKYINKANKYRKDFRNWFIEYKNTLKCAKCNIDKYWLLDFHHSDPQTKDFEVSRLVVKCSKTLLLNEIKKCIVLCANCHRDLHYQETQSAGNA